MREVIEFGGGLRFEKDRLDTALFNYTRLIGCVNDADFRFYSIVKCARIY